MIKTYSELCKFDSFLDRFNYLKIPGHVGIETFGFNRYLNQTFYHNSREWKIACREVKLRDDGCDLGCPDRPIFGRAIVHHMNPITEQDILNREPWIWDPEFLILTTINTHNAIHYSDESILVMPSIERYPNDTCPWR